MALEPPRRTVTLVDSNVLLDVLSGDPQWSEWSAQALEEAADSGSLVVDPIIYAEVSVRFTRIEDLEQALPATEFGRLPLPWSAAFLAGKTFVDYRRRGGARPAPLPDFYIGAHAAVSRLRLLTRDARRYRTYFPTVEVIAPACAKKKGRRCDLSAGFRSSCRAERGGTGTGSGCPGTPSPRA